MLKRTLDVGEKGGKGWLIIGVYVCVLRCACIGWWKVSTLFACIMHCGKYECLKESVLVWYVMYFWFTVSITCISCVCVV